MVMTENSQIHRFFYKSELIKSDHPYQMYDQCSHPGNHTLPYHNTNSPFAAHFTFDRSDSRHTWCIEQTEYQQGCCCQRSQYRGNISTEKYFQSRYHALFCHKSADKSCTDSPVSQSDWFKYSQRISVSQLGIAGVNIPRTAIFTPSRFRMI